MCKSNYNQKCLLRFPTSSQYKTLWNIDKGRNRTFKRHVHREWTYRTFVENLVKDYHKTKKKRNNNRNYTNTEKILWVSNIGPKLGKNLKNEGITFISGKNLLSIQCQNKSKLLLNIDRWVYQWNLLYNNRYVGESKKKILKHCIDH